MWAIDVEASISKSGSWSRGQGMGHRARLAVVGNRMWEKMGQLVPCAAAGSWLTLRRTIPKEAGGRETAVGNWEGGFPSRQCVHMDMSRAPYLYA